MLGTRFIGPLARRSVHLVAVGVLLLGSLGLTLHPALGHADHGPDHTCELCLHLVANPAAPAAAAAPAPARPGAVIAASPADRVLVRPVLAPRSRAPPLPAPIA